MQALKAKVSKTSITRSNSQAKHHIESIIKKAELLQSDPDKVERFKQMKCKCCFYVNNRRIGGAAMTKRECGICESEVLFSSTATDVICQDCASANNLCKQCGADIQLVDRRKPYPFQQQKNDL